MSLKGPRTIEITDPRSWVIKGSVGTLIIFFGIIYASIQWGHKLLDASFLTDSAYASDQVLVQTQMTELRAVQIEQNAQMTIHLAEFTTLSKNIQLSDAVSTYRNAEQALYLHELDEERNGETSRSAKRQRELKSERNQAKEFRDCVVGEELNCEALRPR